MIERAIRLEPSFPIWKARPYAGAYFMAGRYAEALEMIGRLSPKNYNTMIWAMRPAALAALGRTSEAAAWVEQAIAARPDLTIEKMVNEPGYSDAERRRFIETMRVAGFPACAAPEALASLDAPRRLPECEAISDARATAPGLSE
jgi:tetratricopeptide (TPR) repeat protein